MYTCQFCNRSSKTLNSKRQHEIRCKSNLDRINLSYLTAPRCSEIPPTPCKHCGKIFTINTGLGNHQVRCKMNPDRKLQIMSVEGKEKARLANIEKNLRQWNNPEFRKKHQESMRRAVEQNPESYSSSNRGRVKQIEVDGIKLQGSWEVEFYRWAKGCGLNPIRPGTSFEYNWNGARKYYPDFYIMSLDLYVEVKGYETDRDRAKWTQFPKPLCIVKASEIKEIKQGTFTIDSLVDTRPATIV